MRAHAVAPLRRCAVLGVLRYPDVRMRRCAVAPCRRAGFIKMPGRAYAPLRRCAAAPLPRAWTTMQLVAQASFRCYAAAPSATEQRSNGATEQRSNGAELRCCGTDALARSNGARSSGAELRRCGTEHRHGGSEQSNGARSNGGELRRCGQSARSTEHGAEHRSTERSNLEDACSTRNAIAKVMVLSEVKQRLIWLNNTLVSTCTASSAVIWQAGAKQKWAGQRHSTIFPISFCW